MFLFFGPPPPQKNVPPKKILLEASWGLRSVKFNSSPPENLRGRKRKPSNFPIFQGRYWTLGGVRSVKIRCIFGLHSGKPTWLTMGKFQPAMLVYQRVLARKSFFHKYYLPWLLQEQCRGDDDPKCLDDYSLCVLKPGPSRMYT